MDGILKTFKRRVGNTPLLRCTELERRLGVKEVYLKLEGTNPTGHKSDRIAYRIVRDAMEKGYSTITIGTVGYLARSLGELAKPLGIRCVLFVPESTDGLMEELKETDSMTVVETGTTFEDAVLESRRQAAEKDWYDANPGLENTTIGMTAYSPIARELVRRFKGSPATVSIPVGTGSLLAGIHMGFRQLWSNEDIDHVPHIFGGSLEGANAIVDSFERGLREVRSLEDSPEVDHLDTHSLINTTGLFGQLALDAIHDSQGSAYSFDVDQLKELSEAITDAENVRLTIDSAAALGAFVRAKEGGLVADGEKHVIVLSTGLTDLNIIELTPSDVADIHDDIIDLLDVWLGKFTDPKEEISEAFDNAIADGHVLAAILDGDLVGLCVLSHMELDTFFPKYHLSYIAADDSYEGRGVATQLIEEAIDITNGQLSLHVERDNEKAIRLYQKMGLDIKYHRMHYVGKEEVE